MISNCKCLLSVFILEKLDQNQCARSDGCVPGSDEELEQTCLPSEGAMKASCLMWGFSPKHVWNTPCKGFVFLASLRKPHPPHFHQSPSVTHTFGLVCMTIVGGDQASAGWPLLAVMPRDGGTCLHPGQVLLGPPLYAALCPRAYETVKRHVTPSKKSL